MSNWVKVTNDEFEVGIEIATLKKGELQIKYAKDIVAKDKEIERLSKEVDMWNKKYNEQFDIINKLEKYLEEEKDKLARETSTIYEDSLGETRLINEDIFNEIITIQDKIKALKGDSSNE